MYVRDEKMLQQWLEVEMQSMRLRDTEILSKYILIFVRKKNLHKVKVREELIKRVKEFVEDKAEADHFVVKLYNAVESEMYLQSNSSNERDVINDSESSEPYVVKEQSDDEKHGLESDIEMEYNKSPQRKGRRSRSIERYRRESAIAYSEMSSYSRHRDYEFSPISSVTTSTGSSVVLGTSTNDAARTKSKNANVRIVNKSLSTTGDRISAKSGKRKSRRSFSVESNSSSGDCRHVNKKYTNNQIIYDESANNASTYPPHGFENTGTDRKNMRCADYENKGMCIHGALCQYDHGRNPIVVDPSTVESYNPTVSVNNYGLYQLQSHNNHVLNPATTNVGQPNISKIVYGTGLPNYQHTAGFKQTKAGFKFPISKTMGHIYSSFNRGVSQTTIQLDNVPNHMNDIPIIFKYFSVFGKITLIQVCRDNGPKALVTFSNATEASLACNQGHNTIPNAVLKISWFWDECLMKKPSLGSQITRTRANFPMIRPFSTSFPAGIKNNAQQHPQFYRPQTLNRTTTTPFIWMRQPVVTDLQQRKVQQLADVIWKSRDWLGKCLKMEADIKKAVHAADRGEKSAFIKQFVLLQKEIAKMKQNIKVMEIKMKMFIEAHKFPSVNYVLEYKTGSSTQNSAAPIVSTAAVSTGSLKFTTVISESDVSSSTSNRVHRQNQHTEPQEVTKNSETAAGADLGTSEKGAEKVANDSKISDAVLRTKKQVEKKKSEAVIIRKIKAKRSTQFRLPAKLVADDFNVVVADFSISSNDLIKSIKLEAKAGIDKESDNFTAIAITGVFHDELPFVLEHFEQFGFIVFHEMDAVENCLRIVYGSNYSAKTAINIGKTYANRELTVTSLADYTQSKTRGANSSYGQRPEKETKFTWTDEQDLDDFLGTN